MKRRFVIATPLAALALFATPAFGQALEPIGRAEPMPVETFETVPVAMETSMGTIVIALETERAPITAGNFLRYVDEERLDGTIIYRTMRLKWGDTFAGLVQGGTQNKPERVLPPIAHEPTTVTGLTHTAGAISAARFAPGTATGDFSILATDMKGLDADPNAEDPELQAGYAVFGHVVEGMEVVKAIHDAPVDPEKGEGFLKGQLLAEPVTIISVRRVSPE